MFLGKNKNIFLIDKFENVFKKQLPLEILIMSKSGCPLTLLEYKIQ
jgi:hypothetical protein